MFDGHLQIGSGVESADSRKDCSKCEKVEAKKEVGIETKRDHYHCKEAPISEILRANCNKAWLLNKKEESEKSTRSDLEKSLMESRKRKIDEVYKDDLKNLAENMKKGQHFFPQRRC